jgi:hypothetical protein
MTTFQVQPAVQVVEYAVGGTPTTDFLTTFPFDDADDLAVFVNGVGVTFTLVATTETDGFFTGATVRLTVAVTNATVTIRRVTALQQEVLFPLSGRFDTADLNAEVSRLWMAVQDLSGRVQGSLHTADHETEDMELPAVADRAGGYLTFDTDGKPVAAAGPSIDGLIVSGFAGQLLDDSNAAAARATLEAAAAVHGHVALDITNSTATGRSLLTAADAAAARTAISAVPTGALSASGLVMSTARLLGRLTASVGPVEEIAVGPGLTLAAGELSANATGGVDRQVFDASGTWTKPTGFSPDSLVKIEVWGAGGSGSSSWRGDTTLSGGGGGAYHEAYTMLSRLGATETVTVGAGGASRTAPSSGSNINGLAGGHSQFGSLVRAGGGGPGQVNLSSAGGTRQTPGTGSAFTSDFVFDDGTNYYRGAGSNPNAANETSRNSYFGGGAGGGAVTSGSTAGFSVFGGNGGAGGGTVGQAGTAPGGGGGAPNRNAANPSGAGAAGRVIVTVFR